MSIIYKPSTKHTADLIFDGFKSYKYQLLLAPAQSGKTSVYLCAADSMISSNMISNLYIICGMSNTSLKEQTAARANVLKTLDLIKNKINNIHIWFQKDLESIVKSSINKDSSIRSDKVDINLIRRLRNSLIIIDESHFGSNKDGILHKFLERIGISPNGTLDISCYNNDKIQHNIYLLSVSATPYAEVSKLTTHKNIVIHHPGESYRGLSSLNLIDIDIDDPYTQLKDELINLMNTKTYAIIRNINYSKSNNYISTVLEELMEIYDFDIYECNQDTYDIRTVLQGNVENQGKSNDLLDDEKTNRPEKFTVICVKHYGNEGETIAKKYISLVWETHKSADSIAQGLPARMSGYDVNRDFYPVRVFCYKSILNTHTSWINKAISDPKTSSIYIPSSGKNIKPNTRLGNKIQIDPLYQKIGIYKTLDEVRIYKSEYGYQKMPRFGYIDRLNKKTYKMNELMDENGFIRQYLPSNNLMVYSTEYTINYLKNNYPLLAAHQKNDGNWHTSIAKVVYDDINDPQSIRYLLYSYNGPVERINLDITNTYGIATDDSMYCSIYNPAIITTIIKVIAIPDEYTLSDDNIREFLASCIDINTPTIILKQSTFQKQIHGKYELKVQELSIKNLSAVFACVDNDICKTVLDYIRQLKGNHIRDEIPTFTNQKECAKYIIMKLCPNEKEAKTGLVLQESALAKNIWTTKYKTKLSTVCSLVTGINKKTIGKYNFYYA